MSYFIRKPTLVEAVKVKVVVRQNAHFKETSADLGDLSYLICLDDHSTVKAIRPPAGFGGIAGGGIPHVHGPHGPMVLDDGLWVVLEDGQVDLYTDEAMKEKFMALKQAPRPSMYQIRGILARTP